MPRLDKLPKWGIDADIYRRLKAVAALKDITIPEAINIAVDKWTKEILADIIVKSDSDDIAA